MPLPPCLPSFVSHSWSPFGPAVGCRCRLVSLHFASLHDLHSALLLAAAVKGDKWRETKRQRPRAARNGDHEGRQMKGDEGGQGGSGSQEQPRMEIMKTNEGREGSGLSFDSQCRFLCLSCVSPPPPASPFIACHLSPSFFGNAIWGLCRCNSSFFLKPPLSLFHWNLRLFSLLISFFGPYSLQTSTFSSLFQWNLHFFVAFLQALFRHFSAWNLFSFLAILWKTQLSLQVFVEISALSSLFSTFSFLMVLSLFLGLIFRKPPLSLYFSFEISPFSAIRKTPLSRHSPLKSELFGRFSFETICPSLYFFCSFLWGSLHATNALPNW